MLKTNFRPSSFTESFIQVNPAVNRIRNSPRPRSSHSSDESSSLDEGGAAVSGGYRPAAKAPTRIQLDGGADSEDSDEESTPGRPAVSKASLRALGAGRVVGEKKTSLNTL